MIVVDTSAIMAVLLREPIADEVNAVIFGSDDLCIGSPTRLELGMVATGRMGADGLRDLDGWMQTTTIDEVAFTTRHREIAVDAFYRYGKGRHRAALNFGDCMSYAVATQLDAPLLFVGDDFVHTDVRSALDSADSEG